jgi:hypothetical protein
MIVARIQSAITDYSHWLQTLRAHPRAYWWESVQAFQKNWNPAASDPVAMFDASLYNTENRSLWQQDQWQPKRIMAMYWQQDPQTLRWMFDDLYNENKEVDGRIGRFLFGCDELLRDHKKLQPTSVENNHYHSDYRMISVYLAFQFPEIYAPYDFQVFQTVAEVLGARDIPQENDLPRYFKVLRTLKTFLDKQPEAEKYLSALLLAPKYHHAAGMMIAADLCRFIAEKKNQAA